VLADGTALTAIYGPKEEAERASWREGVLDHFHERLEADSRPSEGVTITLATPSGKTIDLTLPSLQTRKRRWACPADRRRDLERKLSPVLRDAGL
jgi:hypothetical protein